MALLDNQPRSASIRCLEDCRFLHLPKEVFQEVMQTADDGLLAMASSLSLRLRNTDQQYHDEVLSRERLRAEAEIQRHRSLSRTVAGVAHEINTPIGVARSAADVISEIVANLLARTDMPEGVDNTLADLGEAARLTNRNIVRASELIQQFKNLSIQQVSEETVTVSLVKVIEETLDLFRMEAASSKLEINFHHQLEDDGPWTGMPGFVSQVLMNLLTNVQRYAYDAEGGEIEILLERPTEAAEDESYLLFFRDHGKGIPEEDQNQVFEPFFTTGRSQGGSGLGLAIVRTLVEDSLGGAITLTSRRGWTEFRMKLPGRSAQP
jgi:signal transduction histidine kinase